MAKTYLCMNKSCSLGSAGKSWQPGRFTGGITKEQVTLLTGDPEPKDHGQGVCPNCGEPGKEETA